MPLEFLSNHGCTGGSQAVNPKDLAGALKPSISSVPIDVLLEVGGGMQEGADKYGFFNWRETGVSSSVYYNATLRHIFAWWNREDIDPDSGIHHISKAIASLLVLRDAQMQKMIVNDDRPPSPVKK